MNRRRWTGWFAPVCGLGLVMGLVAGCTSMEDRIVNVVEHELEECQNSDDDFYTVSAKNGDYDILTDACDSEIGEVEMDTDYRGSVSTGPLRWTARRDGQVVVVKHVRWSSLDRARELADRSDAELEDLEEAEEFFAEAQDEFDDSAWLRQRRLENLIEIRDEQLEDDADDLVGDAVREYYEEFVEWAEAEEKTDVAARAHLSVISHIEDYIDRQESSLSGMGAQDERLQAAADHAEDDGDMEAAREYRDELEERLADRPERREALEDRVETGQREKCEYTDGLHVDGVEDDRLRRRISSLVSDRDSVCDFDEEPQEHNGDD